MKTAAQITFAERLGQMLGRAWRGCAHLDRRAQGWLLVRGWAPGAAKVTLLVAKLVAFGLLLYAAFWLALLVAFSVVAAWVARNSGHEETSEEWAIGDQAEYKSNPGYDPILYNDAPDSRYDND
ncbi:MAG: hypothetical protein ABS43_30995 [Bordetella sp. SCN 67-23]|nr:MAG: hypothetical protein ABS43_30995 [Bordetella sp. SCN 67-23]